jgi:N6-adenosine-specific RNA methylase IME4
MWIGGSQYSTFEDVANNAPRGGYSVIYEDPPWKFVTRRPVDVVPYPTMTLPAIKALPVADIAARDCHLFMWTTGPFLEKSFEVLKAHGFRYSTVAFVWVKLRKKAGGGLFYDTVHDFHVGQGYTTRSNAEFCLLGRRGRPQRLAKGVRQLIVEPLREHSRKPETTRERIVQYAEGPRLEMFARSAAPGFDAFGNQIGMFPGGEA